jgi:hypothetical protein
MREVFYKFKHFALSFLMLFVQARTIGKRWVSTIAFEQSEHQSLSFKSYPSFTGKNYAVFG